MNAGAVKAPTIQRSDLCRRSRQSVSTSPSRCSRFTELMPHPMHLHGHAFQVVAINGASLAGAVRDTVLVPPMGSVTVAFAARNPGRLAFHCHILSSRR